MTIQIASPWTRAAQICKSLQCLSVILNITGVGRNVGIAQSKYLNKIVEQDHSFTQLTTRPKLGLRAFNSASATITEIETAHIIRKGQLERVAVNWLDILRP